MAQSRANLRAGDQDLRLFNSSGRQTGRLKFCMLAAQEEAGMDGANLFAQKRQHKGWACPSHP